MSARRCIIPVFVPHLGCPNNCVFCNQHSISGESEPATEKTAAKAISEGLSRLPAGSEVQVAFYGGSFTAIPETQQNELLGAAQAFFAPDKQERRVASLRLSTRPDAIDEGTLERLREYGVTTVELGAQSMCSEVLLASGRGHTAEDTERACALIKARGLELILQMMTGLPGDTRERAAETARRIIALKPDGVRIYPTVIVENTPLCDMWRCGEYAEHTVQQAVDYCAALLPMFEAAGIPVIRLGLNPTEDLSGGAALAGAYHPALGELVRSKILLDKARALLSGIDLSGSVTLGVNPAELSAMIGQHRENIARLRDEFSLEGIKIRAANVPKGTIILIQ